MATHSIANGTTIVDGDSLGVVPGDVIVIEARIDEELLLFRDIYGTADNPVIVRPDDGIQVTIDDNSNSYCFRIETSEYVRFSGDSGGTETYGFVLRGQATGWAVRVTDGAQNVFFDHIEIPTGNIGFSAYSTQAQGYDNTVRHSGLEIDICYVHDITDEGVYQGASTSTDAYYDDVDIHHSIFVDTGLDAVQVKHGANLKIRDNTITRAATLLTAGQRSGIRIGNRANNSSMYKNRVEEAQYNAVVVNSLAGYDNNRAYNNIIFRAGAGATCDAALLIQVADEVYYYNNTIVDTDGDGLQDNNPAADHYIYNNIVCGSTGTDIDASGSTLDGNQTGTTASMAFVDADNDNYRITADSPAVDAGVTTVYAAFDYYGVARPQGDGVDVGAVEYEAPSVETPVIVSSILPLMYRVRVYDTAGTLLNDFNDFLELEYTKRVNAPGLARVLVHGDHDVVSEAVHRGHVEVWRQNARHGIDWYRDFGGFFMAQEQFYTDTSYFLMMAPGWLDMLRWRHVMWTAGEDGRSAFTNDPAESIMKDLVTYNCASSATVANGREREGAITGLSVETDLGRGNRLDWNCAWRNVLGELQDLALVAGGDFDLVKTGDAAWEFRFFEDQRGSDLSDSVTFSLTFGNMGQPRYKHDRIRERTAAVAAYSGKGENRLTVTRLGEDYSASNDVEMFLDARRYKTEDGTEDYADRQLDEARARQQFTFKVLQTPGSLYGKHYCVDGVLGDLVTARYGTVEVTQKVMGATVRFNADGEESIDIETETQ